MTLSVFEKINKIKPTIIPAGQQKNEIMVTASNSILFLTRYEYNMIIPIKKAVPSVKGG